MAKTELQKIASNLHSPVIHLKTFKRQEMEYLKKAVQWGINDLEDESNQPLSEYGDGELSMLKTLWNKLNAI